MYQENKFNRRAQLGLLWVLPLSIATKANAADSPVGYWTTIDDDGKTKKAVVKIESRGGALFGTIVRLINPPEKAPICDKCKGAKKNKPVEGLEILWGLRRDGSEWNGGEILDPKNGKTYKCLMELEDGGSKLKVRGYVGISLLGRTQTWIRTKAP